MSVFSTTDSHIDVLKRLTEEASVSVFFTIPFADDETARALEPFAPSPDARFKAMRELAENGINVGLGLAPLIPGLSTDIPELLKRAKDAGATRAFMTMLRLPGSVASYFEQRLRENLPTKAERVLNRIREAREGRLNSSEFGKRMRGQGEYWQALENLFRLHAKRLGFNRESDKSYQAATRNTFRRPAAQGSLFD